MRVGVFEVKSLGGRREQDLVEYLEIDSQGDTVAARRAVKSALTERGWTVESVNFLKDSSKFDIKAVVSKPLESRETHLKQRATHRGGIHGGPLVAQSPATNTSQGVPAMTALQRAMHRAGGRQ